MGLVPPASVRRFEEPQYSVVVAEGEIDVATSPMLHDELAKAESPYVVVDLTGVSFFDSTGLGVLIGALRDAREAGGWVRLVGAADPVVRVLEITKLDTMFPLYDTVEAAAGADAAAAD